MNYWDNLEKGITPVYHVKDTKREESAGVVLQWYYYYLSVSPYLLEM